jgi:hypothetical protein
LGDILATIYKELTVKASPEFVWGAIRDVGAVHRRLAQGFVKEVVLEGDERTVTFSNGVVVREQIISISDELQRLAYKYIGGRTSHSNCAFQVFAERNGSSKLLWVIDLLPEEAKAPIEKIVDLVLVAIKQTLEKTFAWQPAIAG